MLLPCRDSAVLRGRTPDKRAVLEKISHQFWHSFLVGKSNRTDVDGVLCFPRQSGDRHLTSVPMIRSYKGISPTIPDTCYVDESAQIIGDVVLGEHSSIWMNCVVRGDVHH